MPFWDFIRDIFGKQNLEESKNNGFFNHEDNYDRNSFRNPIWQNNEDDDDINDFRHSRDNFHFHIFNDLREMTRLFFTSQMDDVLKNFMFEFGNEDQDIYMNKFPFTSPQKENLHDKMLKPSANLDQPKPKLDMNLDVKINSDNFSEIWDQYNESKSPEVFVPDQHVNKKSMYKMYVRKFNGTIERKKVFRDSEGNEETILSQQIGDKIHTIITKRDKHGVETKTENFDNIDESELIRKEWLPSSSNSSFYYSRLNYFPWEKFFKDPKL